MRVAVEARLDHVREATHPVMLIRVVVSELLVLSIQRHVENVAHTVGNHFEPRAIGTEAKDASREQIGA